MMGLFGFSKSPSTPAKGSRGSRSRSSDIRREPAPLRRIPDEESILSGSLYTDGCNKTVVTTSTANSQQYLLARHHRSVERHQSNNSVRRSTEHRMSPAALRASTPRRSSSSSEVHPNKRTRPTGVSPAFASSGSTPLPLQVDRSRSDMTNRVSNRGAVLSQRGIIDHQVIEIDHDDSWRLGDKARILLPPTEYEGPVDVDDESSTNSCSVDISKINISDKALMDRCDSPGALRLTKEGLRHHESKVIPDDPVESSDEYLAWKLKKQNERRQKKTEAQQESTWAGKTAAFGFLRAETESSKREGPANTDCKVGWKAVSSVAGKFLRPKLEDDTDVSLVPLTESDNVKVADSRKRGLLFFRKNDSSESVQAMFERERVAAIETRRLQRATEAREKHRLNDMRRSYLEKERAKEATAAMTMHPPAPFPRAAGHPISPVAVEDVADLAEDATFRIISPASAFRSCPALPDSCFLGAPEASTISQSSTTNSSPLPPCVVCHTGDRTHIATPCMHYSFCADCVKKFHKQGSTTCPVCQNKNVMFAVVSM